MARITSGGQSDGIPADLAADPTGAETVFLIGMLLSRRALFWGAAAGVSAPWHKTFAQSPAGAFPKVDGLTLEVATFICNTAYRDIPEDVIELGKKSILDGLGLALCGSVAETGRLSRDYVKSLGLSNNGSRSSVPQSRRLRGSLHS